MLLLSDSNYEEYVKEKVCELIRSLFLYDEKLHPEIVKLIRDEIAWLEGKRKKPMDQTIDL